MELEFINTNKNGDFYIGYRINVKRGIHGKTKSNVNELIIAGVPKERFPEFCKNVILKEESMKENDATETAYKNGYDQGKIDANKQVKSILTKLYDEMKYDEFHHNCPLTENYRTRLKEILEDL